MKDLSDWITKLKASKRLIIVEGKKDKAALESFGVKNIITLNKPLFVIVEEVSLNTKECIILTDLDEEGRKLYHSLKHQLQRNGVKIDTKFREFLFRTKVTCIENLPKQLNL